MTSPTTIGSRTAPTEFVAASGVSFAYRRFGTPSASLPPLVFIHHFMGTLDTHDTAVTDTFARKREVILFDNPGVGRSSGAAPTRIHDMAADAASFIRALGMTNVDVLGFSMGGEVAQQLALDNPDLVRRLVLVGTGPRGGQGMAALAPDVAPLFEVQLDIQERMWLPIFFSPSQASQASGERYGAAIPMLSASVRAPRIATSRCQPPPSPRTPQPSRSGAHPGRTTSITLPESTGLRWSSTAATTSSYPQSIPMCCNSIFPMPSWSSTPIPTTDPTSNTPTDSPATSSTSWPGGTVTVHRDRSTRTDISAGTAQSNRHVSTLGAHRTPARGQTQC